MNPDRLTQLLAAGPLQPSRQSPDCPGEDDVAAYVERALAPPACEQFERHAADCDRCIALVGALSRQRGARAATPVTPQASSPTPAAGNPARRRWIDPRWAAAAALVLVVPVLLQLGRGPDRAPEPKAGPDASSTRNVSRDAEGLRVIAPAPGAAMPRTRLSFEWTEVPGTPYYDVRILSDEGDVVARQRVSGSRWQPAPLTLRQGAEYFVVVDAYPSGDKAVSSRHIPFRVSD